MKNFAVVLSCVLLVLSLESTSGQENQLSAFENLTAHDWIGHYVDSEDSNLTHNVTFEYHLGSRAVVQKKIVPEIGFEMETYFYWDWSDNRVAFLSLMNKDLFSTGWVEPTDSNLTLWGQTYFEGGQSDFKITYEINNQGRLVDRFYRRQKEAWVQGHLIVHDPIGE